MRTICSGCFVLYIYKLIIITGFSPPLLLLSGDSLLLSWTVPHLMKRSQQRKCKLDWLFKRSLRGKASDEVWAPTASQTWPCPQLSEYIRVWIYDSNIRQRENISLWLCPCILLSLCPFALILVKRSLLTKKVCEWNFGGFNCEVSSNRCLCIKSLICNYLSIWHPIWYCCNFTYFHLS